MVVWSKSKQRKTAARRIRSAPLLAFRRLRRHLKFRSILSMTVFYPSAGKLEETRLLFGPSIRRSSGKSNDHVWAVLGSAQIQFVGLSTALFYTCDTAIHCTTAFPLCSLLSLLGSQNSLGHFPLGPKTFPSRKWGAPILKILSLWLSCN